MNDQSNIRLELGEGITYTLPDVTITLPDFTKCKIPYLARLRAMDDEQLSCEIAHLLGVFSPDAWRMWIEGNPIETKV